MRNIDYIQLNRSFENRGYKLTPKRRLVFDYLVQHGRIQDTETVWLTLREQKRISWATVYTTIKLLRTIGWIEPCHDPGKTNKEYRLVIRTFVEE